MRPSGFELWKRSTGFEPGAYWSRTPVCPGLKSTTKPYVYGQLDKQRNIGLFEIFHGQIGGLWHDISDLFKMRFEPGAFG